MCKHCWDEWENGPHHKDFIRGGVEESDFEDVTPHKKKAAKKPRKRDRCPETENGRHVYVWTTEFEPTGVYRSMWNDRLIQSFYAEHGFFDYERRVCCGCGKKAGMRRTAEYNEFIAKWKKKNKKHYYVRFYFLPEED